MYVYIQSVIQSLGKQSLQRVEDSATLGQKNINWARSLVNDSMDYISGVLTNVTKFAANINTSTLSGKSKVVFATKGHLPKIK